MLPNGRTFNYAIWRACERLNIPPPGIPGGWDDLDVITQSRIISYSQIRILEDVKSQGKSNTSKNKHK